MLEAMVDTSYLLEAVELLPLADEALGAGDEALRVVYGPTFHPTLALTIRRVGELAELEAIEGRPTRATERRMITPAEATAIFALLPAPIVAFDRNTRDGIAAHAERWDGRAQVVAALGNPCPRADPAAHGLLVRVLDFAAARLERPRTLQLLATIRGYLDDHDPPWPPTRL